MYPSSKSSSFWESAAALTRSVCGSFSLVHDARLISAASINLLAASHDAQFSENAKALPARTLTVKGKRIECLRVADRLRRQNRTLVMEAARNTAIISGKDIVISWRCSGYCRAPHEEALEFSIDADSELPFADLVCLAYDVGHDPNQTQRIRPVLVGLDAMSKKISVPFLRPLSMNERFSVLVTWTVPNCMARGVDYYTATFSFDQESVPDCTTELVFLGNRPKWLEIWRSEAGGGSSKVETLRPATIANERTEYRHTIRNSPASVAWIYLFERPAMN